MSVSTNTSVGGRVVTALFDSETEARQAIDDLVAAGVPGRHMSRSSTASGSAEAGAGAGAGDHRTFWESLTDFFLPHEDRHAYAEGLTRGGILITVQTEEGNISRVLDILDRDGAVNMDERETAWRAEGWDHRPPYRNDLGRDAAFDPADPLSASQPLGSAAQAKPATPPVADWRKDDAARAAALDGSVPAAVKAARLAARDTQLDRPRLRTYTYADTTDTDERTRQTGAFSAQRDASRITEHMTVYSADGQNIGTVDHLDGPDRIKLTRTSSPDGQHHIVPFTWIDHVDQHVHLNKSLADIRAQQNA